MTSFDDDTVDLFGKTVTDLQSNVSVSNGVASGSLKYIADYTSAGFDMSQGNHFVVLLAETEAGTTTTATIDDRTFTLDDDGILVFQMTEAKKAKSLVFTTSDGEKETVKTIALSGLTLEPQGE